MASRDGRKGVLGRSARHSKQGAAREWDRHQRPEHRGLKYPEQSTQGNGTAAIGCDWGSTGAGHRNAGMFCIFS